MEAAGEWSVLIERARAVLHPAGRFRRLSKPAALRRRFLQRPEMFTSASAIDTACSLGMCAERNAAANMITNGEPSYQKACLHHGRRKSRNALRRLPRAFDAAFA